MVNDRKLSSAIHQQYKSRSSAIQYENHSNILKFRSVDNYWAVVIHLFIGTGREKDFVLISFVTTLKLFYFLLILGTNIGPVSCFIRENILIIIVVPEPESSEISKFSCCCNFEVSMKRRAYEHTLVTRGQGIGPGPLSCTLTRSGPLSCTLTRSGPLSCALSRSGPLSCSLTGLGPLSCVLTRSGPLSCSLSRFKHGSSSTKVERRSQKVWDRIT